MSLRDRCIQAGADVFKDADHKEPFASAYAEAALDAILAVLSEHATPMFRMGALSPAWYIDDDPDEDTTWVIDLAVLADPEEDE